MTFFSSFSLVSSAVMQLFILAGCGFVLVRKGLLSEELLKGLSRIVISLLFPAFIFYKLVSSFSFAEFPIWWIYPIFSFALAGLGYGLSYLFLKACKDCSNRRELLASVTFQNAGYLPLVLIAAIFQGAQAGKMFVYLFLFILGFNLMIWTFGVRLLAAEKVGPGSIKNFFNAPVNAILFGLVAAFLGLKMIIPVPVMGALKALGDSTLPFAMIVVGGELSLIKMNNILLDRQLSFVVITKLLLLPFVVYILLLFIEIDPLFKFLVLLEASMPTAVSLSVITRRFDLKGLLSNQAIFWTHALSLLTLPFLLVIFWRLLFN